MAYVHTQALIRRKGEEEGAEPKMLFVTGPGHGAPAILSPLYIEGAITKFYPQYGLNEEGLEKFVKYFSWPGGFPSHVNAETPGCIHEGGELGYALGVAYGSVMDRPDQISVVVVGDGESETGPTATAWQCVDLPLLHEHRRQGFTDLRTCDSSHKWLDPAESGAVLPILHVNGFKISERTIPGVRSFCLKNRRRGMMLTRDLPADDGQHRALASLLGLRCVRLSISLQHPSPLVGPD